MKANVTRESRAMQVVQELAKVALAACGWWSPMVPKGAVQFLENGGPNTGTILQRRVLA